ncbi:hypothetical protein [Lactococcus garvieae]|uniref:hypothetical protein n=1 Tax=Lactococcus garvieae TaxID=1363 RepID=UPI003851E31D
MRYNEKSIYESRCLYSECREVITVTAKSEVAAKELFAKFGSTNQPKLSIPKKIAELLDTSNGDWGNVEIEELDYWIFPNIPDGKESYRSALCEVYLAGKALGVELVEVTDE